MTPTPPILIAAVGNATAGADAFGSLVLQALAAHVNPAVQLLDLATNPTALLDHLPGRRLLVIVDAALQEDTPSPTLLDINYFSPHRPALASPPATSTHALSLADQLALARTLNLLPPEVRLIAALITPHQAANIESVRTLVPQAVVAILQYTIVATS
jgi:hydrogenase maturation protease